MFSSARTSISSNRLRFEAVLRHRDVIVVLRSDEGSELLTTDGHLRQSYEQALGSFGALQFGERLDITPQNANNRLKRLHASGAVNRSRARVDRRGKEFLYSVVC